MINSAKTGEGFSPQRSLGDCTPHPTEFGSAVSDALSHKGRGRSHAHRDVFFERSRITMHHHSAASATGALGARSTTLSVVRMRWVVPSWKRITVSTGISPLPP